MFVIIFLVSLFFLTRTILIMIGLLKGPILRSFEKYGDDENLYNPLLHLIVLTPIFAFSAIVTLGGGLLSPLGSSPFIVYCLITGLAAFSYAGYGKLRDLARDYPAIFLAYPQWYMELRSRTSRTERRRIAYMWLRLPWRTRLMYNSNDGAFRVWLDLVIMASVRPEPDSGDPLPPWLI